MAAAISTTDVKKAATELASMRRALSRWLKFRAINDQHGGPHDASAEQALASKLSALLGTMFPTANLPLPDVTSNPQAAVQLAQIALTGNVPTSAATPGAMAGVGTTHPWLWPVLIVGGLLIAVTTAIKSAADVAAQKEQDACIQSGACTDYGFWLKIGGLAMLAYVAWNQFGLKETVRGALAKRR